MGGSCDVVILNGAMYSVGGQRAAIRIAIAKKTHEVVLVLHTFPLPHLATACRCTPRNTDDDTKVVECAITNASSKGQKAVFFSDDKNGSPLSSRETRESVLFTVGLRTSLGLLRTRQSIYSAPCFLSCKLQ